jgi:hypothetical protein
MPEVPLIKEKWKYHLERIPGVKQVTVTSYPENKNLEPGQLDVFVLYDFWAQLFWWRFKKAGSRVRAFLKENKPINIEIFGPDGFRC